MAKDNDRGSEVIDRENDVIPEGGRIHVPMLLMDEMQRGFFAAYRRSPMLHQPGQAATLTDAETDAREAARNEYIARLTNRAMPASDDEIFDLAVKLAPLLGLAPPGRVDGRSAISTSAVSGRTPGRSGTAAALAGERSAAEKARDAAYDAHVARIADSWKVGAA
jgi:hypothetical protein